MKRSWIAAVAMVFGSLVLVACGDGTPVASEPEDSAAANAPEPEGRIAFVRGDPEEGETVTYTVNPDGTGEEQLFLDGPWLPYVEVCDISRMTERARAAGASVILSPREGPVGWRSVLAMPTGSDIAL